MLALWAPLVSQMLFDILDSMLALVLLSSHVPYILNFCNSWASPTQLFISLYSPAILAMFSFFWSSLCLPIGLTHSFSFFPVSLLAMFSLPISLFFSELFQRKAVLSLLSRIKALPRSSHIVNLHSVQVRFFSLVSQKVCQQKSILP